mgnify:CR=1 FL=1|tara:strand:+ start:726 stop:1484 length:759 start_codon:yes stop_codon:yes gene_type:complete
MNNNDLKEKYNEVFSSGSSNFFTCNVFKEALEILNTEEWENKVVLDIGCGEGILPAMIVSAGAEYVTGVDYSKEAIANAVSKFNFPNLLFVSDDYKNIRGKFDIVTMQGVLEHLDEPWEELDHILTTYVKDGGSVVTSSPSFLNPRGYVWMTLAKLFDVPMSLTDLHFICPFDMKKFCETRGYKLEYKSIYQDWGSGETMIRDFNKRLRNALNDAGMDNSKVDDLLLWLNEAKEYFKQDNDSGAIVVYRITK